VASLRLSSRSQSRGGGSFTLPSLYAKPTKKPQTDYSAWGRPFFILKQFLCPQSDTRGLWNTISFWQVFWLPRPLSDLPIPIG